MADICLIKGIISTYDLPRSLERRLVYIAYQKVKEFDITRFDDIYEYIGYLVEKHRIPYGDRVALRLDGAITSGSEAILKEWIGIKDSRLVDLLETGEESTGLSINEAVSLLDGRLDRLDLELLKQLASHDSNSTLLLPISREKVVENAGQIQQRIRELAEAYAYDGHWVIPRRPVVSVGFNPFRIKFGPRRYDGNPLAFFRANEEIYGRMSRSQLRHFDHALEVALRQAGQLSEAMPSERLHKLSQEAVDNIIAAHSSCNGNALKAAQNLSYAPATILRYWKQAGLLIRRRGKHEHNLTEEQVKMVNQAYDVSGVNSCKAAKYLGIHSSTIIRYWKQAGLQIRMPSERDKKGLRPDQIKEIVSAHAISNANALEASKYLPFAGRTILRYWKQAGLPTRHRGCTRNSKTRICADLNNS